VAPLDGAPMFETKFQEAFGSSSTVTTREFLEEIEYQFSLGANPEELSKEKFAEFQNAFDAVAADYAKRCRPFIEDVFTQSFNETRGTDRLDIRKATDETQNSLSESDRGFFAHYGILPPYALQSLTDGDLTRIEKRVDVLAQTSLNSSLAYLFSEELLDLALNPEIVARVASLLGDDITFLGTSGPMYKAPYSEDATPWHSANAQTFGGGTRGTNFDLVTCWVALTEANLANGCMKILPRSYTFNCLKLELLQWDSVSTTTLWGLVDFLKKHAYRFDLKKVAMMLSRRLAFSDIDGMYFLEGGTGNRRYNPFHSSIDMTISVGENNLANLSSVPGVLLNAKRGDMYTFISQNSHGSFSNQTGAWRKAIALRYAKTGLSNPNIADDSYSLLKRYLDEFPGTAAVLEALGKNVDGFSTASPRICVRGAIPDHQRHLYVDSSRLRDHLRGKLLIKQY
jgi:ectoine hydroxylase-related dioxygenase (phytanoyl-CoA dioxygenase family)